MPINTVHSMNVAGATVDGVPVIGLWDGDDAIMFEPQESEGEHLIGADGSSVWSQFSDRSGYIMIKVQSASPTNVQLAGKKERQESGLPVPFTITFFNLGGAEAGTATNCFVETSATISLGKNATVREWKISCADLRIV